MRAWPPARSRPSAIDEWPTLVRFAAQRRAGGDPCDVDVLRRRPTVAEGEDPQGAGRVGADARECSQPLPRWPASPRRRPARRCRGGHAPGAGSPVPATRAARHRAARRRRPAATASVARNDSHRPATLATWVCWSITSLTRIAHGSSVARHGRSCRPFASYHRASPRVHIALSVSERSGSRRTAARRFVRLRDDGTWRTARAWRDTRSP